jgi:hydrogenase expression/formation protein HypC
MNKIDEEDALESLRVYREILDVMDEQERLAAIAESDNCPSGGA